MAEHMGERIITVKLCLLYTLTALFSEVMSCDPAGSISNHTDCHNHPVSNGGEDDTTEGAAMASYNSFYIFFIIFGVIGLPSVVLLRVCWVRRLNARQNSLMTQARNQRHLNNNDSNGDDREVFVIAVDPEHYLPTYDQSVLESPPSYDQLDLPPPYNIKKNKSSASLPSYSEEYHQPSIGESTQACSTENPIQISAIIRSLDSTNTNT